ncbi:hypothetical protein [Microlunatus ginsengisoli]|uniref:PE family protein n=1 Tax=Microlunatus ginsengisoli TaxID=363863 RepID=A0ABP7ANR1_9ACTN
MPDPTSSVLADRLHEHARAAGEHLTGIAADTLPGPTIPAPSLLPILARLEELTDTLDRTLRQLGGSVLLGASVPEVDDYDRHADPGHTAQRAADRLDDAATFAYRTSLMIASAHAQITGLRYAADPDGTVGANR